MGVEIRKAQPTDVAAIHRITQRAYSVWVPVLGYPPLPVTEDHLDRIERGEVFVACDEEGVVGLIAIEPGDDHDLIFNVAVDPDQAGRGIGRQLIDEVEQHAKAKGKSSVTLYTNALMDKNITFYMKLGYIEKARRPHPSRVGFTLVDMAKPI